MQVKEHKPTLPRNSARQLPELWIHVDFKYMPPTVNSLQRDIIEWGKYGASGILFEWENMFPYPGLNGALRSEAYSPAEIQEILSTCREANLKPVPLVQTLGHLEWLLSHERYAGFREFREDPALIKICDPEAVALLCSKLDALLVAHVDSPFIHLGADEAYQLHTIRKPALTDSEASDVFLRHLKPLFERVIKAGKTPLIWADMPLHHPHIIKQLPDEVVLCDWNYNITREHDASVWCWDMNTYNSHNYHESAPETRDLFEPSWRIDAPDFPERFYQFPYTSFLKDRGRQVMASPSTLCGGNSLAATNLPKARANAREWIKAARRFDTLGAINTCWAIRGALRESTRTGHRAFLLQGNTSMSVPDAELSAACWEPIAGLAAEDVARCVDELNPPSDDIACAHPHYFDAASKTHRMQGAGTRLAILKKHMDDISPSDDAVTLHLAAIDRGWQSKRYLASIGNGNEEIKAWELGAAETAIRATMWLLIWARLHGGPTALDHQMVLGQIQQHRMDVRRFMIGKYFPADIEIVCGDRYDQLMELLSLHLK